MILLSLPFRIETKTDHVEAIGGKAEAVWDAEAGTRQRVAAAGVQADDLGGVYNIHTYV